MAEIFNVKEPRGASVIESASGAPVHVDEPLPSEYLTQVGGDRAIERASAARRRVLAAAASAHGMPGAGSSLPTSSGGSGPSPS